ncbi:NUDIX hydrolase [Roseicella aquatilis]|uniref:NUDIX hydrolase n=1 Tax=Roseicella aquatilis TaxID=2527868 RepID=A0A4R4DX10_9PROT|nr:NUDIX hydrolase [Roseicella aquatilis]TCZ65413.1 NUDIX hydrolase [Roseicella aquatilis]
MPRKPTPPRRRQCAALPLSDHEGEMRVLLVTSRETRRWVIPKGWVEKRHSAAAQAAQEAYEEAGIRGRVAETPIGSYGYRKRLPNGASIPCEVEVYSLEVDQLLDRWPEMAERERRWFTLEDAAAAVQEDGLGELMLGLAAPRAA